MIYLKKVEKYLNLKYRRYLIYNNINKQKKHT